MKPQLLQNKILVKKKVRQEVSVEVIFITLIVEMSYYMNICVKMHQSLSFNHSDSFCVS